MSTSEKFDRVSRGKRAAIAAAGVLLVALAWWSWPRADSRKPEVRGELPRAAPRTEGSGEASYVAWCRKALRQSAQQSWDEVRSKASGSTTEKMAIYLAEWLQRDSTAAIRAFGELGRDHPELIGEVAVLCGERLPDGRWEVWTTAARKVLAGQELKAFLIGAACGMAWHDPAGSLQTLESVGELDHGKLLSAQSSARNRVIETVAKQDVGLAVNWICEHKSWEICWGSLCYGVATSGLASIPESDLTALLTSIPAPSSFNGVDGLVGMAESRNKSAAQNLLRALEKVGPEAKDPHLRAIVITAVAEHVPETFEPPYFTEANAQDAYFAGLGRRKDWLSNTMAWAEGLGPPPVQEQAIRGMIDDMMKTNFHMTSMELEKLPDDSPAKRVAIQTAIEWLSNNNQPAEAAALRARLDPRPKEP